MVPYKIEYLGNDGKVLQTTSYGHMSDRPIMGKRKGMVIAGGDAPPKGTANARISITSVTFSDNSKWTLTKKSNSRSTQTSENGGTLKSDDGEKLYCKSFIDDKDLLKVKGSELWFEHISGSLPGKWANNDHASYVNKKKWMPVWKGKVSDHFVNVNPALPIKKQINIKVLKAEGGKVLILEQPSRKNEYTLTLKLEELQGGAHWMEFTIGW